MDLEDQLKQIASRISKQLEFVKTEEATKNAFIMPFIAALGFNVFDPTEVVPEFVADVGLKKGEKVDYVIIYEGKPALLIECKPAGAKLSLENASQLYRYFAVTEARFAVLTNGIEYQFYTDIEAPNKMDSKPFFEFTMNNLDAKAITEVKKFAKSLFNVESILSNASELKYLKQIKSQLDAEVEKPSEELVKLFTMRIYEGRFTEAVKTQFTNLVQAAMKEWVRDKINLRLQSAIDSPGVIAADPAQVAPAASATVETEEGVVTTPEELEAFHIVRAILAKTVDPKRVVMRDTKSYCGILLDDNNRKPICRLRFNYSQKYLGLFDANKAEEKIPIGAITELYQFESRLAGIVALYDSGKASVESEPSQG
ncbi:MAG: type I restriction enzyme HsdR N-terminal domain-containing protein [Planctomycetaceae bacterium]|nr:type I restriction enzyme HsdR N-terminal domain-containing protein [Planctomycetaceae bacterium]